MRLLRHSDDGRFIVTEDLTGDDIIPPYAILSHTWEKEEVTFQDLMENTGESKAGYFKIRSCGQQALQDGLQYFWVDTCCIDRSRTGELQHAINSMFRWYQNAVKCYVYLSDVPIANRKARHEDSEFAWEPAFRASRWFTRGWTLQELLAPSSLEFYSKEWKKLGAKEELTRKLHEITGIPESAIQGVSLSQFDTNTQLSWMQNRQTKLEEDKAYALIGIVGVYIPALYGEGMTAAFRRLMDEIQLRDKCIQDLYLTNPVDDKTRIEQTKGGLLGLHHWILDHRDFQQWRYSEQSRLLWIKGDPGKGKTMLLCGIINELEILSTERNQVSYFFCQATDSRINNATAVLQGLMYLLVKQQPSLVSHIQKRYNHSGKALFSGPNAWVALSEIFTNILQDLNLNSTFLVIDALDECVEGLPKLLAFIAQRSCVSARVKWIVSSRAWPDIEDQMKKAELGAIMSLELNEQSVSTAVNLFIEQRVHRLSQAKNYDTATQALVREYLSSHSNGTFLWVALVCQSLETVPKRHAVTRLYACPPGLDALYERMMQQMDKSEDIEVCKEILAVVASAYRPLVLDELTMLVKSLEAVADEEAVQEIIGNCGSFLTSRGNTIYFVHQSAKDFLLSKASETIFPSGKNVVHYKLFARSLQVMSIKLVRDIYNLKKPGYLIQDVVPPVPDPLIALRYSCIYWAEHLCECDYSYGGISPECLQDGDILLKFLEGKFLCWLETLSLCKSMASGVRSLTKVRDMINKQIPHCSLIQLVHDACRFMLHNKTAIETAPLQAYFSALMFSPKNSLIQKIFRDEAPPWLTMTPAVSDNWGPCVQILEGHTRAVNAVSFCHDSTRLASASNDSTIKIWDTGTGECLNTLKGHELKVTSVAFSNNNSTWLASGSFDGQVKIWDVNDGRCLKTLMGHIHKVQSLTFSCDSSRLASLVRYSDADSVVKIWDTETGKCLVNIQSSGGYFMESTFLKDSSQLMTVSETSKVEIWSADSGECMQTYGDYDGKLLRNVAFSHDRSRLASVADDGRLLIWEVGHVNSLEEYCDNCNWDALVAFSHDSSLLAFSSNGNDIQLWDTKIPNCMRVLQGQGPKVTALAFSHDSSWLASASLDRTTRIWDVGGSNYSEVSQSHSSAITSLVMSNDSAWLASGSYDDECVNIWDVDSGECLQTLGPHGRIIVPISFSHDSKQLVSASYSGAAKLWDTSSGMCLRTIENCGTEMVFSYDSILLISVNDKKLEIFDVNTGKWLKTLAGHRDRILQVVSSPRSKRLASASTSFLSKSSFTIWDSSIRIWDTESGKCLQNLHDHQNLIRSIAFSPNSEWLISSHGEQKIKIWDVESASCLRTFESEEIGFRLSLDATTSYLRNETGKIIMDFSEALIASDLLRMSGPRYKGWALSPDARWVTYDSETVLWLPQEYRTDLFRSVVLRNVIITVNGLGIVRFLKFSKH